MAANPFPPPGTITDYSSFYGREGDVAVVRSHLMTRRWTVLHGRSGAGKSSLFAAGIQSGLRSKGSPHEVLILDWRKISLQLFNAVAVACGYSEHGAVDVLSKLRHKFGPQCNPPRKLLLIIDHFEQYLSGSRDPESDNFLSALIRSDLLINICAGIRNDELYRLDRLRSPKFNPFDNLIALPDLDDKQVRQILLRSGKEQERLSLTDEKIASLFENLKEKQDSRVLAAILSIVCYEAGSAIDDTGSFLKETGEGITNAIQKYCSRTLDGMCPRDSSSEKPFVEILDLMTRDEHPRLITKAELQDHVFYSEPILKSLVDERLVEKIWNGIGAHDHSYTIVHDRFVQPIQTWTRERKRTLPSSVEVPADNGPNSEDQKRGKLLERQLSLAWLGLGVAWADVPLENAKRLVKEVWPHLRDCLDPVSKIVLRGIGIRYQVPSPRHQHFLHRAGYEIRPGDGFVELRRPLESPTRLRTQGNLQDCSFSSDGECIVACDDRDLYVWDLAGALQIRVPYNPAGFAAAMMSPEEIYERLVHDSSPQSISVTEDLVYTFQELAGDDW